MKHIPSWESHFSQELEIHICLYNKYKKLNLHKVQKANREGRSSTSAEPRRPNGIFQHDLEGEVGFFKSLRSFL